MAEDPLHMVTSVERQQDLAKLPIGNPLLIGAKRVGMDLPPGTVRLSDGSQVDTLWVLPAGEAGNRNVLRAPPAGTVDRAFLDAFKLSDTEMAMVRPQAAAGDKP